LLNILFLYDRLRYRQIAVLGNNNSRLRDIQRFIVRAEILIFQTDNDKMLIDVFGIVCADRLLQLELITRDLSR